MPTPGLIQTAYNNQEGVYLAPVLFRDAYYIPLTNAQAASGTLTMWKSTDGITWTDIGDTFVGVVFSSFTAFFNGNFIVCLVEVSTGGGEVVLISFDLNTGTWGVPFGSTPVGSGINPLTNQLVQRPDGSIVGTSRDKFWVWDGVSWTSFAILTNIPAGFVGGIASNTIYMVDASGLIHSVTLLENVGNTEQSYFYQQFTTANALGDFASLDSITFPDVNFGLDLSNVIVNQTKGWVSFAVQDNSQNARVFVGQGLSSPIWSLSSAIDPTALSTDFGQAPTLTNYNDTQVWLLAPETDDQTFIEFGTTNVTNPLIGWTLNVTVVAPGVATLFETNWQATSDPTGSVFFTEEIAPSFNAESFFALGGPIPPPPPPPPTATIVKGPMVNGYPINGIVALPDAATKCDVNGRKRCVFVRNPRNPIQVNK
jgi:hypothetical protein